MRPFGITLELSEAEALELSTAFSGLIGPGLEPVEIDLKELEV